MNKEVNCRAVISCGAQIGQNNAQTLTLQLTQFSPNRDSGGITNETMCEIRAKIAHLCRKKNQTEAATKHSQTNIPCHGSDQTLSKFVHTNEKRDRIFDTCRDTTHDSIHLCYN